MNAQTQAMFNEFQAIAAKVKANAAAKAHRAAPRPAPVPRPAPTLDDYRAALAAHDWFYEFSDDHSVWGNGRNQEARLRLMAKALDPDFTIWKQYAPATR